MSEFALKTYARVMSLMVGVKEKDRGATAVEYGLMVALIAAVIIVSVTALGANLSTKFGDVATKIANAGAAAA
ncbi:MAG TPA: Flp family type IVb pilin [Kineosporiaceae bacterium]|jgi:pilus assembly protein Flp/PilA|nr:Flp family type IVb pilin [Kineosporiaceae bacterium]